MRIDNLPSRTRHLMRSPQNGKAILISIDSLGTFRKTSSQAANVVNVRRSLKCCRFESWYNVSSVDDDAVYSHWTESQQDFFFTINHLTSRITHLNIYDISLYRFLCCCAPFYYENCFMFIPHLITFSFTCDLLTLCIDAIILLSKLLNDRNSRIMYDSSQNRRSTHVGQHRRRSK